MLAVGAPILAFVGFLKMVTMALNGSVGSAFTSANAHLCEKEFAYVTLSGHSLCSPSSDNHVLQNMHQKQFSFAHFLKYIII